MYLHCLFCCVSSGIFAYLNYNSPHTREEIINILISGLKRLEYRGYDSAGMNSSIAFEIFVVHLLCICETQLCAPEFLTRTQLSQTDHVSAAHTVCRGYLVTCDLEIQVNGHSRSSETVPLDRSCMTYYQWSYLTLNIMLNLKCRLEVTEVVPFESFGTVSYSPSIVTMATSLAMSEIFSIKEWPDLEIQVRGHQRSLKMVPFDRPYTIFYWSAIVDILLSCTIFELFHIE